MRFLRGMTTNGRTEFARLHSRASRPRHVLFAMGHNDRGLRLPWLNQAM